MTLTTSCEDQLDIEQKGVIPTENFYKTDADAEAALVAAYEGFMCNVMGRNHDGGGPGIYTPLKLILNECGDDVLAAGANIVENNIFFISFRFKRLECYIDTKYHLLGSWISTIIETTRSTTVHGSSLRVGTRIVGDGEEIIQ